MLRLALRILHRRYTWFQIERALNALRQRHTDTSNPLDKGYQWP